MPVMDFEEKRRLKELEMAELPYDAVSFSGIMLDYDDIMQSYGLILTVDSGPVMKMLDCDIETVTRVSLSTYTIHSSEMLMAYWGSTKGPVIDASILISQGKLRLDVKRVLFRVTKSKSLVADVDFDVGRLKPLVSEDTLNRIESVSLRLIPLVPTGFKVKVKHLPTPPSLEVGFHLAAEDEFLEPEEWLSEAEDDADDNKSKGSVLSSFLTKAKSAKKVVFLRKKEGASQTS